jgi:hypothetical protein
MSANPMVRSTGYGVKFDHHHHGIIFVVVADGNGIWTTTIGRCRRSNPTLCNVGGLTSNLNVSIAKLATMSAPVAQFFVSSTGKCERENFTFLY